ncbi:MAG: GntR family transcriptional regulator [Abditibacteriota bacterium]|nr:GntR family transcriptional regulator [Abditibacteriota bacterium]
MKYLYEGVKRGVKEQIKRMKHGDRLPSERELSDVYKVDRITVRRALKDLEREGYVVKKRGAGNFVNDKNVDEENKVSLLMPTFSTVEHSSIYKSIRKYIDEKDIAIELFDCALNKKQEDAYLDYLEKCKVNKIIIYPFFKDSVTKSYAQKLNAIANKGKKLVILDQFVPGVDADFVLFDKYKICYRMFEYLIGKGHRSIVYFNTANDNTGQTAKRAYDRIIHDYDIDKNPLLYEEFPIKNSLEPAQKKMGELIKSGVFFTAVVSLHGSITNGILRALKDAGLEDKEVLSVYHKGHNFELKKPYVVENIDKLGTIAMEILFSNNNDNNGQVSKRIHYIESKFIK